QIAGDLHRVQHVAAGLRHALAFDGEVPMPENLPRERQAGAHQHRRPQRRVEANQDVLADQVPVRRPPMRVGSWELEVRSWGRASRLRAPNSTTRFAGTRPTPNSRGSGIAADGDVVDQRVEPDVQDLALIVRYGD